jgi:hypothetical protein
MGSEGSTWLPIEGDDASTSIRFIAFVLLFGAGVFSAKVTWDSLRGVGPGKVVRRLLGRPERVPWASGEWACGACHSVNRPTDVVCGRCRATREATQMQFAGIPTEPDIVPASIPADAGSSVLLEHNAAAHLDGLNGHWRLRVNSVIVGSAARRDGAVALLRAIEGVDAVLFDANGAGYGRHSIASLIGAFEGPKLPLNTPCPERFR